MLILLWLVTSLSLVVCYRAKAGLAPKRQPVRRAVLSLATDVLFVVVVAGSLVLAIAWWAINFDAPDARLQQLWKAEQALAAVQTSAGYLRIPSVIVLIVLSACALSAHRRPRSRAASLYTWLSRYQQYVKRALLLVAALASFSVFGGLVDGQKARIEARLKSTAEQYSTYRRELKESSEYAAAEAILGRVIAELPPNWKLVQEREEAMAARAIHLDYLLRQLESYAEFVQQSSSHTSGTTPGGSSASRSQTSADHRQPSTETPPSPSVSRGPEPQSAGRAAGFEGAAGVDAGGFSEKSLGSHSAKLRAYRERVIGELSGLLSTPLGQKLPASVLDVLLSHKNWDIVKAVAEEYPLLGAVVEVLEKALSQGLAERVRIAIARSVSESAATGATVEAELRQTAAAEARSVALDWAGAEPLVLIDDARTRAELTQVETAIQAADAAVRQEIRRIRMEESQMRRTVEARWEREGSEFDRRFGVSFVKRPSEAPPAETSVHHDGRRLMVSLMESVAAEWDWRVRRQLLTEFAAVVNAPSSYSDRAAQLTKIAGEPERRRRLEQLRENERLSGLPEGSLSKSFENALERAERLERREADKARIAQEDRSELDAYRAREAKRIADRYGVEFDPVSAQFRTRPFRIGSFEIPGAPMRVVRMLSRVRVR
jgi:hypothetical protein